MVTREFPHGEKLYYDGLEALVHEVGKLARIGRKSEDHHMMARVQCRDYIKYPPKIMRPT